MEVNIDKNSGFCFGVMYAIDMAQDELDEHGELYCLGDIVHNDMEIERLKKRGLKIITHENLKSIKNARVLIRAHGEPPETYKIAIANNLRLIDASCPVVLKLQNRIREDMNANNNDVQLVIYGKQGHAEVNGLEGQTKGRAIIVNSVEELDAIDFTKPIHLFSQTTQSTDGFREIKEAINSRKAKHALEDEFGFEANDTLCRQVSNREPQLKEFSQKNDVIIFVSGKKSSNGKVLYENCKAENPNTYFISETSELNPDWFINAKTVGVCGATSTPMWHMEEVANKIKELKTL